MSGPGLFFEDVLDSANGPDQFNQVAPDESLTALADVDNVPGLDDDVRGGVSSADVPELDLYMLSRALGMRPDDVNLVEV